MPRDQANENNRHKINDLSHFLSIKTRKIHSYITIKYREGGRTVGSGTVATIIE